MEQKEIVAEEKVIDKSTGVGILIQAKLIIF